MKRFIMALTAFLTMTIAANAMSYEQARNQALFLTDKMAYELNLTEEQYEAAFEINLDYLLSVNTVDDLYGTYWTYRNLDLSYILFDWQYRAFCDAAYFYRPIYWNAGYWRFRIYARYPHREYYYFGRPRFYTIYRGGHSWRMNGGRSWYRGRSYRNERRSFGMRDGFKRGDYRYGYDNARNRDRREGSFGNAGRHNEYGQTGNTHRYDNRGSFGNSRNTRTFERSDYQKNRPTLRGNNGRGRESSTRTTVTRRYNGNNGHGNSTFNNGNIRRSTTETPRSSFTPRSSSSSSSHSFGTPSRSNNTYSSPSRGSNGSFGGGHSNGGGHSGGGHFGGRR